MEVDCDLKALGHRFQILTLRLGKNLQNQIMVWFGPFLRISCRPPALRVLAKLLGHYFSTSLALKPALSLLTQVSSREKSG